MKIFRILLLNVFLILCLKVLIIESVENIEVDTTISNRNNRQLYQVYSSTKYTIPNRQTTGQIFTPDYMQNYQNQQNNQQNSQRPNIQSSIGINFNQNVRPYSSTPASNSGGGKFMFPDAYETSYTVRQTKQQPLIQHKKQDVRQTFDKELGSFCRRSFDQKNGNCAFAHQCLHIVREFRVHGVKLDVCSYQGNLPVICCPPENKEDANTIKDLNRISAKKCAEYSKFGVDMLTPSKRANHSIKKCEPSIPLIVGGEETLPGEYPHMAAIGWIKEHGRISWACGGTLISEIYILTAAHCTSLGGKSPNLVKLGAHDVNAMKENVQELIIIEIIPHPKYNKEEYYNDIALLKLNRNVNFSKYVRPACLWFRSKMNDIEIVTATGWGRTRFLGPKSDSLLKVDLEIVDREKCNELYKKEIKLHLGITNDQFCAGYLEGGKDTCQGDSGGPINVKTGKYNCVTYVVGITSFGKFCAAPNSPGVYTKIHSYLDWIESIVFK